MSKLRTPRFTSPSSASPPKRPTDTTSRSVELRALLASLATERGFADNSLHAYRRDLEDVDLFLQPLGKTLRTANADDFRQYLRGQSFKGQSTRTVARRVAAIRALLFFFEDHQRIDTSSIRSQLDRPKPERSLPKVLSNAQVVQLISAPSPKSSMFARDVAILELLYASGLRASEICGLKV